MRQGKELHDSIASSLELWRAKEKDRIDELETALHILAPFARNAIRDRHNALGHKDEFATCAVDGDCRGVAWALSVLSK